MHIPDQLAAEIVRQGEVRLNAVMTLSTASVARATTLCGIFGGASVALVAGVLAYFATENYSPPLIWAGAATALLLFLASFFSAFAAVPRDFRLAGGMPQNLRESAWGGAQWRSTSWLLDATARGLAEAIEVDRKLVEREAVFVRNALWFAGAAVPAGVVSFFFAWHVYV
jgi:hypothetical protein